MTGHGLVPFLTPAPGDQEPGLEEKCQSFKPGGLVMFLILGIRHLIFLTKLKEMAGKFKIFSRGG